MEDTSPFFRESSLSSIGRAGAPTITRHIATHSGVSRAAAATDKYTKPDLLPAEFQNCSKTAPNILNSLYLKKEREGRGRRRKEKKEEEEGEEAEKQKQQRMVKVTLLSLILEQFRSPGVMPVKAGGGGVNHKKFLVS